jgi:hypothetical protein
MTKINIAECDIVYLSYDEPNWEENYTDLLTKAPWAKHVHGVKGSDAAHKACAEISETERFITVDGDNKIYPNFINQSIEIPESTSEQDVVISWCGKNIINDLTYGNGGLKCWPKERVLNMRTHENADQNNLHAQVDFCWDIDYLQQNDTFSTIHNNETPHQAWRAGFREGVKLALDRGVRVDKDDLLNSHQKNLNMLYVWLMIGSDVNNGDWAIYGARQGLYMTMCTDWDYINVRDFEYLNNLWIQEQNDKTELLTRTITLGTKLVNELEIPIDPVPLNSRQSKFIKNTYTNIGRIK